MAITTSILTGGSNNHETTSQEANAIATDFVNEGIVGDIANTNGVAPATGGFAVNAQGTPDMTVAVSAGAAYVTATPTAQASQALRVANSATSNVTISANSSGSTKYDWIYISISASNAANPNTAADDVATLVASRSSSASTDDGSPPTYGYPLAVVTVANGASSITNGNIRDIREKVVLETGLSEEASGWLTLGYTPNTITANGNRSYDLVFNSTDLTDTLTPGMRLQLTRTVSAPTQCTDLESGSSQYWSKSSPTGISFTDDFTCMAWVKLESYGATMKIIAREDGTNGWAMYVNSSGQVAIAGQTAGNDSALSYQSLPLGRWTHVAASLDSSGTSGLIYFDGVLVPSAFTNGGGSTITQGTGALQVGAGNGASFFDGKIAQAALFNAVISASTIRSYMSQTLSGSETNCIGAFTFNGNGNDSNANANNLTAQGSAVATNSDSPFALTAAGVPSGTTEYAVITKVAFSTDTTVTVQVPEGGAIPTSGGVSAVSYSTQKVPYGFPASKGKWRLSSLLRTVSATTSNATYGAFISGGWALNVQIGSWDIGWQASLYSTSTTEVYFNVSPTALTGLSNTAGYDISPLASRILSPSAAGLESHAYLTQPRDISSATSYVMYTLGTITTTQVAGTVSLCEIFAEFNLL